MAEQRDGPDDQEKLYRSREFTRGAVTIAAEIREQWGGKQKIAVIDLSRTGFRMKCVFFIPDDRIVFLTMPGFEPMEAGIAWHDNDLYGCKFKKKLHEAVFDHVIRSFPQLNRSH